MTEQQAPKYAVMTKIIQRSTGNERWITHSVYNTEQEAEHAAEWSIAAPRAAIRVVEYHSKEWEQLVG